jgi:hypothetical protein
VVILVDALTATGGLWQFNADMFETVDGKQFITGKTKLPHPELLCIFVGGRSMVILLH